MVHFLQSYYVSGRCQLADIRCYELTSTMPFLDHISHRKKNWPFSQLRAKESIVEMWGHCRGSFTAYFCICSLFYLCTSLVTYLPRIYCAFEWCITLDMQDGFVIFLMCTLLERTEICRFCFLLLLLLSHESAPVLSVTSVKCYCC